jgi:hypothetical protein
MGLLFLQKSEVYKGDSLMIYKEQLFSAEADVEQIQINLGFKCTRYQSRGTNCIDGYSVRFRWLTALRSSANPDLKTHPFVMIWKTTQRCLKIW